MGWWSQLTFFFAGDGLTGKRKIFVGAGAVASELMAGVQGFPADAEMFFFFHHRVHPKFTMNFDRLLWWKHPYQNPNGVSIIPNMAIFKRGIYTIPPFSHGDGDSLCWYLPRHPKTWVQVIARHECKWMVESKFDWYTYILMYIHINIHT